MKILSLLYFLSFSLLAETDLNLSQYRDFIIDHVEMLNSYKAGMRFKINEIYWDNGPDLSPREPYWCSGKAVNISTVLMVGMDEKYYLLEEKTVTLDRTNEYYEICKEINGGNEVFKKNTITLKTSNSITLRNFKNILKQEFLEIKKMAQDQIKEKYLEDPIDIYPSPEFCPNFEKAGFPTDRSKLKKEGKYAMEVHKDYSLPQDFSILKMILDGEEHYTSERLQDANLDVLNEKYKDLMVDLGSYQYPIGSNCMHSESLQKRKWGAIVNYGKK